MRGLSPLMGCARSWSLSASPAYRLISVVGCCYLRKLFFRTAIHQSNKWATTDICSSTLLLKA